MLYDRKTADPQKVSRVTANDINLFYDDSLDLCSVCYVYLAVACKFAYSKLIRIEEYVFSRMLLNICSVVDVELTVKVDVALNAIIAAVGHNERNAVCAGLAETGLISEIGFLAVFNNISLFVVLVNYTEELEVHINGGFAGTYNIKGNGYQILLSQELVAVEVGEVALDNTGHGQLNCLRWAAACRGWSY